jgi:cysteine synthase A
MTVLSGGPGREWINEAIRLVQADANRSADTHLIPLALWPQQRGVDIYLKDESTHPTGSLKHRLARSLFLYGLCNGWIREGTTIVEASSGSTAISEAYFARMLDLPFLAVVPASTSSEKIALIEREKGRCHLVDDPSTVYREASRMAEATGGHYMDQFTFAERATDWRGNNNIAETIFRQMALERHPIPRWIVVGAGTGGTSATIGRYLRYCCHATALCVVDPEDSAFHQSWRTGDRSVTADASRIEGIGRPRVEPSFVPTVVERMVTVPDAASIAAVQLLRAMTGRQAGPSTGTNLWGALQLACELVSSGQQGSIVTLLCDGGERYADTYYSDAWLVAAGLNPRPYSAFLQRVTRRGEWTE